MFVSLFCGKILNFRENATKMLEHGTSRHFKYRENKLHKLKYPRENLASYDLCRDAALRLDQIPP